jgi:DNA repair photolyase
MKPIQTGVPTQRVQLAKGRGATSNLQGRYECHARETFDDGWTAEDEQIAINDQLQLTTEVIFEKAKSILSRNSSPDVPFNVSLNPYRGCEHGCIYCFARPTHSYLGLSPGLDFETKIVAKSNAAELLRDELAHPKYVPEPIAVGVNTDGYQPCERDLRITRQVLEILHDCGHPVSLITKSSLVERDIDLLRPMAAKSQAAVAITITTLSADIARKLEPRAAAPARRLRTIRTLTEAGIPVRVNVAPIIPFVTEPELEKILVAASEAGAVGAGYIVLRLPWEVNPIFQEWLQTHFPDRANRVMNRVREMRGGKDYDSDFRTRMHGEGVWADLIKQRFEKTTARLGLDVRGQNFRSLDISGFRATSIIKNATNGSGNQLPLF